MQRIQEKTLSHNVSSDALRQIFILSTQLADATEAFLEEHGEYRPVFLRGLKKSLAEARSGKVKRIATLAELG